MILWVSSPPPVWQQSHASSDKSQDYCIVPGMTHDGTDAGGAQGGQLAAAGHEDRPKRAFFPQALSSLCGSGCLRFQMPFEDGSAPRGSSACEPRPSAIPHCPVSSGTTPSLVFSFEFRMKCFHAQTGANDIDQVLPTDHWGFISHFKRVSTRGYCQVYAQQCCLSLKKKYCSSCSQTRSLQCFCVPYLF